MTLKTSWVGFKLDISEVNKIIKYLLENPDINITKKIISESINMRIQMVESYLYWARYLGIIKETGYEFTEFGKKYKEIWGLKKDTIYEILYYKAVLNNKFLNILVNDIFYRSSLKYPRNVTYSEIDDFFRRIIDNNTDLKPSNLKKKSNYINSLTDDEGFGCLKLVEKASKRKSINIKKHLPTLKGAYYILVMNQIIKGNNNQIIDFNKIANGRNHLCRLFMLNEEDISFILDELIYENLIKREKVSHFNQIYIKESFLTEGELIKAVLRK